MPPICNILKPFDLYRDGTTPEPVAAGQSVEIPDELFPGLNDEGFVALANVPQPPVNPTATNDAPENKALQSAPENGAGGGSEAGEGTEPATLVEIPEGWADLPWPELRSLAAAVSDTPINSKDEAIAAIQAETEARAASEDKNES